MFTLVCHPLEIANKINDADHILITLRVFFSLTRELTITLGFQSTIERADSPVREIICPWFLFILVYLANVQKAGDFLLLIHIPEMYDLTDASTYTMTVH